MSVNSCPNSGPLSVTILNGLRYLDSQPFSTAAAPSWAVVEMVCLISTRLVHGLIIFIAWQVNLVIRNSIFHGPMEVQCTSCQGGVLVWILLGWMITFLIDASTELVVTRIGVDLEGLVVVWI